MSLLILWLGVMFPLVFSPGPANIVFAMSGAKVGVKSSLPLLIGIDLVFIVKSIIIGFWLGQIIYSYPTVLNVLQMLGAIYLMYLAMKFLSASTNEERSSQATLGFIDGVIVQLLNSKGWLMVVLMFALFTEKSQLVFGELGIHVLIIWLAILNISIHLIWIKAGALIAKISSSETYEKALNIFYASCLFGVSVWLIVGNQLWSFN